MGKKTVQNAIKEDLLNFLLPAAVVYSGGIVVSAWDLIRRGEILFMLSVQSIVGLALIIVGLIILFVAAVTLRGSYSSTLVIREAHQLITHGIYRFTRHPIYLGAIMVCIGVPVTVSSPYGLLIMLLLIPLLLRRIRIEERLLSKAFGEAHRKYKEATSKLIPFIY